MFKENLTNEELNIARQNGFILTGKTGTGKSTLLNVIFSQEVAEAKKYAFAVTKESQVYYLKLNNGRYISLVDTPGLSDPDIVCNDQKDLDNIHLKGIEKIISDEKIHIKGILFLVNFQLERFDESEQRALISYNKIFPLKRFWKHLIVIFTHDYSDPNGDTPDEMRQSRDESNSLIFSKLMEKVKNVSDVINYKELRIKYYNSYSPVRNENQKIQNTKNKEDLEILLNDLSQKQPLFCQIEVKRINNEKIEENGKKYLIDYETIGYFDLNHLPIKEITTLIKKEEIKEKANQYIPPPSLNVDVYKAQQNNKGVLNYTKIKGDKNSSKYLKNKIGAGVGGVGGAALGAFGGLAYVGGVTTGTGVMAAITAGAGAAATALAAPVAIGIGVVGVIGAGLGYGISKLFD
jgi:GTPase Era involved in 16S rRNA processing